MEIKLEDYRYYIRPGYTDMRKGPTSLAYLVQYEMGLTDITEFSIQDGKVYPKRQIRCSSTI